MLREKCSGGESNIGKRLKKATFANGWRKQNWQKVEESNIDKRVKKHKERKYGIVCREIRDFIVLGLTLPSLLAPCTSTKYSYFQLTQRFIAYLSLGNLSFSIKKIENGRKLERCCNHKEEARKLKRKPKLEIVSVFSHTEIWAPNWVLL